MVLKKGKKKTRSTAASTSAMGQSLPATPAQPSRTAPSQMQAGMSAPGAPRLRAASPTQDEFSEPESSLFDYELMNEAGHPTVGFGTWPSKGRHRRGEQPAQPRFSDNLGGYAEPGDLAGFGDGDSPRVVGDISDLYAKPLKKGKGKGKSSIHSGTGSQSAMTMSGTERDVQEAMQKIHDMPRDDTISKTLQQQGHISFNFPGSSRQTDSGHGSQRESFPGDEVDPAYAAIKTFESPEKSPDLVNIQDQMSQARKKVVQGAMQDLEARPGEVEGDEAESTVELRKKDSRKTAKYLNNEAIENLLVASKAPSRQENVAAASNRSIRTPRSTRSFASDMELHQVTMEKEEMMTELTTLRKVAEALKSGDMAGAQHLHLRRRIEEMEEENETLKTTVHRLNVELSDYQAKFRPVDQTLLKQAKLSGLPSDGPIPSWLVSKRYLAPLFLAYDDHIEQKDKIIEECKRELSEIQKKTEAVLKENQRLRMMGGGGLGDMSEWHQLQEQARLVLEENQILMEQLEVQTSKSKDMYSAHMAEISRLAKKCALSEGERADTERELEEVRVRYRELKHKHDQIILEQGATVNVHSHINTIADLKRSVTEEKERVEKETESIRIKLKASEEERKSQAMQMVDLTAENKRLKAEVKAMQKSVKRAQEKMAVLHRAIELSEDKEMITQEQLANVIKVAEKTALERDTVYKVAREQQAENKMTVNKMMHGSVEVGKLEEKLKLYRMRASAKLNTVADRLKEQDEAFNSQKKEYEREIQYLRLLLKEKDEIIQTLESDKKDIERDLDTMWQAASSENQRVKNILLSGTRKLKDNTSITDALKAEMEGEELLHFSVDDDNS